MKKKRNAAKMFKYSKAALLCNEVTKAMRNLSLLIFDTQGEGIHLGNAAALTLGVVLYIFIICLSVGWYDFGRNKRMRVLLVFVVAPNHNHYLFVNMLYF